MIDIKKLDKMLRVIFAEGYNSGHDDGVSGNRPTKLSSDTHAHILAMAEESNRHQQDATERPRIEAMREAGFE